MLTGLAILRDTSLELTSTGSNDENSAVSLGGTSDHVLDEVTVTGGVDDGDIVLRGLELPEGDVDGDTTLTLSLELVKDPGVLEGTLAELSGFLLWRWLAYGRTDGREWLEALVRGVRVGRTPVTKNPDAEILPKTKRGLARASPTKKLPLTREG